MTDQTSALAAFEGSVEHPARSLGGVKAVGVLGIVVGVLLIAAGIVVCVMAAVQSEMMTFDEAMAFEGDTVVFLVSALTIVGGLLSILFGWALHRLAAAPVILRPSRIAEV